MDYTVRHATPTVDDYRGLRELAGLTPKTVEAAARGLPNTLFAVQVLAGSEVVGMGRVVGDGGCAFQVVDVAVLPEHQGRGLGKVIMREIVGYLEREVPESGHVTLFADGEAHRLYRQFGFRFTGPACVGMEMGSDPSAGR